MKIIPLILILTASVAIAAPSQRQPERSDAARQAAAEPPRRTRFFGKLKNIFKPGPVQQQQRVVAAPPTQEPKLRPPAKRRSSGQSSLNAAVASATPSKPASTPAKRSSTRQAASQSERSPSTASTSSNASRPTSLAPRSSASTTPSGMLAPVSTPAQPAPSAPAVSSSADPQSVNPTSSEFNRERYLKAKAAAARDPQVEALASKLEAAEPGESYKTAAKNYTKALFSKIREVDSSQNDWIERLEAATLRRIEAGKAIVVE